MDQYIVTGMTCAACQARVEKAVSKVPGVTSCSVSLLTNSMGVEGTASKDEIITAVQNAGYGAALKGASAETSSKRAADEEALKDHETPKLKRRLFTSLGFLLVLMYVSMGHSMFGFPLPKVIAENHVMIGIIQMLLAGIVMVINQRFFISGFKSLLHLAPNMDTLVALGSAASFLYSVWALLAMSRAQLYGDAQMVMHYAHEFYFEGAAMILTLITVGKMLEARSKGKTTDALKSLMKLSPKTATILVDGAEKEVPIEQVKKGDVFVVRPGENIPVDGIVVDGSSAVNEAALTGESIPVDKEAGDLVSAATTNQSGFIRCEATRVGEDTTLSKIIQMVSDAAATKAPIAKVADRVSGVFVPAVIGISVVTFLIWMILKEPVGTALTRAVAVLVISCPCALGLATPVAIMVGNGKGAKNGVLFKTAVSLEETGKVDIVALDKTGTITAGEPKVTDLIPAQDVSNAELLSAAYSLEAKSEHPLAKAVIAFGDEQKVVSQEVTDFEALAGNGLTAKLNGAVLTGGSYAFISGRCDVSAEMKEKAEKLAEEGKTPLLFTRNEKLLGMIAVADVIKEDSPQAVRELQDMGIQVVMLTGDNERTAKAIGRQAGVDQVIAGVLPDGKENVIRELKKQGKVAMVGDGINDAPALTRADMGIAIGAGADVAVDAADVVLMKNRLSDVPAAVRLSRATLRNIHQNLFWAFFYNVLGIPLAAGAHVNVFGWQLNPMFGAAAMSLSSFFVVSNALRLNFFDMHSTKRDRKKKHPVALKQVEREEPAAVEPVRTEVSDTQETVIRIEGIMCEHCERAVKNALEKLDGVKEAKASHADGKAVVILTKEVPEEEMKKAVEEEGYTFLGSENKTSQSEKTLRIEGMMCEHCERAVKNALESLDGVKEAKASHTEGKADIILEKEVPFEEMKKAVENEGYKVISME